MLFRVMSYSTDLRERVLGFIAGGGLIKDVCKIFVVSRSSVQRYDSLYLNCLKKAENHAKKRLSST